MCLEILCSYGIMGLSSIVKYGWFLLSEANKNRKDVEFELCSWNMYYKASRCFLYFLKQQKFVFKKKYM